MDETIDGVLNRVARGVATEADAHLLHRRLFPNEKARIIEAYLTLSSNAKAARRYIAPHLRKRLADQLQREG